MSAQKENYDDVSIARELDCDNRRRSPRVTRHFDVCIKAEKEIWVANAVSLSSEGLRVLSQKPIPENSEVETGFYLDGRDDLIKSRGRIVWSKKVSYMGNYLCGIEFTNAPRLLKDRIVFRSAAA